jgi:hypothetical protein
MCDYSLERLASRPAKVGDHLITTKFRHSLTGGFCAVSEPDVAFCLQPGTELAFDREIESGARLWPWRARTLGVKVARFRRVNEGQRHMHHDALELPGGKIVMLTSLREGQRATVLQLPVGERIHKPEGEVSHHVLVAD